MWFMNKIANPLVGLILRSRLHGLMSAALLIITYRGRKTGRKFSLPVQYAQDGNIIYIVPGMPEQKTWWRNLKGGAPVQLSLRGETLTGNAILLKPDTDTEAIITGFGLYIQRFPALVKYHHVRIEPDGRFNGEDLRLAAAGVVIIRVELQQK